MPGLCPFCSSHVHYVLLPQHVILLYANVSCVYQSPLILTNTLTYTPHLEISFVILFYSIVCCTCLGSPWTSGQSKISVTRSKTSRTWAITSQRDNADKFSYQWNMPLIKPASLKSHLESNLINPEILSDVCVIMMGHIEGERSEIWLE